MSLVSAGPRVALSLASRPPDSGCRAHSLSFTELAAAVMSTYNKSRHFDIHEKVLDTQHSIIREKLEMSMVATFLLSL